MVNFIESYIANNFGSASSYAAGMNFTNLIIAVPIIATLILLIVNGLKNTRHLKLFGAKFNKKNQAPKHHESKDTNIFEEEITNKIALIKKREPKNILINGHWGSGKTYFAKNRLTNLLTKSIYISCIDYPNISELVTSLIKKSNNIFIRALVSISLSRLIALIGHTELKQYIGTNKVIIFDEFERLVDYNKIDPMHIVSLIQYLNDEKNCICILIANEDRLNEANQFNNVREKLISYIYHYKLPFDNVLAVIEKKEQDGLDKSPKLKSPHEQIIKSSLTTNSNGNKNEFSDTYLELKRRYNLDNNIRMLEHTYKKINEVYQSSEKYIKFDDFKSSNDDIKITKEEFFALLFSNVLDLINPLYYLYLKNPYNLHAVETLAIIYTYTELNLKNQSANRDNNSANVNNKHNEILKHYLDKESIQSLALNYHVEDNTSYENKENKLYDKSYDLNYIITNQIFENINMKLITDYLGNEKIVSGLLPAGEHGKTLRENIRNYMRLFKDKLCESEDQEFITDYFKTINVLEQRFDRLIKNDENSSWDSSIVTDYIAYCKYIDDKYPRDNPNNIRPVSYNCVTYINALIIQMIIDATNNIERIVNQIINNDKNSEVPYIYELTCIQATNQNKINFLINTIKQIVNALSKGHYDLEKQLSFLFQSYNELTRVVMLNKYNHDETTWSEFVNLVNQMANDLIAKQEKPIKVLDFMYNSYDSFKNELLKNNTDSTTPQVKELIKNAIILSNKNLISLLTQKNKSEQFISKLFMHLSNFNDGYRIENFKANSLLILVAKIKEIYNTPTLQQEFINTYKNHAWDIPKLVAAELETELKKQNNQETEGKE